jgi:MFS family permease
MADAARGEGARKATRATVKAVGAAAGFARGQLVERVGGPARARVITLFACVLALSTADASTIGAVAPQLEQKGSLHLSLLELGTLNTVTLVVGALFVIPVGLFVDRVKRMPLLSVSVSLWSVASLASALAPDYTTLLLTRLALGAVTATAGPAIASLTGDYFPAKERGRVYAYILAGEVAGTALGFIVSGSVSAAISWRAAFVLLAIPGVFLARALWRTVPEPLRGGQSYLEPGVEDLHAAVAQMRRDAARPVAPEDAPTRVEEIAHQAVRRRGVSPDPRLILREDPNDMTLGRAIRYTLQIPSNVMLILSNSLGYFYFAGLSLYAITFVMGHYKVSQVMANFALVLLVLGALAGTLVAGRLSDSLVRRGFVEARVLIPAVCYLGAVALLLPGIISGSFWSGIWFDIGGAALLSAANPPLNAAALDIFPARLWGRAQSVRSFVRNAFQALAPLIFGGIAQLFVGITPTPGVGTHLPNDVRNLHHLATGVEVSFLVLLATLAAAGIFLARARHTYPVDVATAAASQA